MKRSEINYLVREATDFFTHSGWVLPPSPKWDVTDFGLGDWRRFGLVLINLAEEPEYCEKLMYAKQGMETPAHKHLIKKEDIVCRRGAFKIQVWKDPSVAGNPPCKLNGSVVEVLASQAPGIELTISAGERITLSPGLFHAFWPITDQCIIGEVSTANDDVGDNVFIDERIGRFTSIEEDEPALVRLVCEL